MMQKPSAPILALLLVGTILALPVAVADDAWSEGFATGIPSSWARDYGTPLHDATNGKPGGAVKISDSNYGISRNVGWAGDWPLYELHFRVASTSGNSGFRMTMAYTGPDGSSPGSQWLELTASNQLVWGSDFGSWSADQSGSLSPAADTWYMATIQGGHDGLGNVWVHQWFDWCACFHQINTPTWEPVAPVWRVDRVHIEGLYAGGTARNIFIDNARVWSVAPITAPGAPWAQARYGPDACPDTLGAWCDSTPFADYDGNDIEISWGEPETGNAPILAYRITRTTATGARTAWEVPPTATPWTLQVFVDRDLPPGIYTYTVAARNYRGFGLDSAPVTGISVAGSPVNPGTGTPTVFATASDSIQLHFGSAGASASLTSPAGTSMNIVYTGAGALAGVARIGFDGRVLSATDSNGGPMSAAAFTVTCPPRPDFQADCLVGEGVDGTWTLRPATNDAARPAGSITRIAGLTFDDWATANGHDARFTGAYVRHWNWHEQQRVGPTAYQACAFACHVQGPAQESLEFTRIHA